MRAQSSNHFNEIKLLVARIIIDGDPQSVAAARIVEPNPRVDPQDQCFARQMRSEPVQYAGGPGKPIDEIVGQCFCQQPRRLRNWPVGAGRQWIVCLAALRRPIVETEPLVGRGVA